MKTFIKGLVALVVLAAGSGGISRISSPKK